MEITNSLYIFHLHCKDQKSIILHPFGKEHSIVGQSKSVQGIYGSDPQLEVVNEFREFMYRQLDHELRGWLSDHRFIPRFLISSLVFLVVYFVLNFVIRDPIPFLIQGVGALITAILAYNAIGKRDELSSIAVERRSTGRALIDEVNFIYSPILEAIEDLVDRYIEQPNLELDELIRDIGVMCESKKDSADTAQDVEILRHQLPIMIADFYGHDVMARMEHRFKKPEIPETMPFEALVQWAKSYKADAGLLALYLGLR